MKYVNMPVWKQVQPLDIPYLLIISACRVRKLSCSYLFTISFTISVKSRLFFPLNRWQMADLKIQIETEWKSKDRKMMLKKKQTTPQSARQPRACMEVGLEKRGDILIKRTMDMVKPLRTISMMIRSKLKLLLVHVTLWGRMSSQQRATFQYYFVTNES